MTLTEEERHGRVWTYIKGCRCMRCSTAKSDYDKEWRRGRNMRHGYKVLDGYELVHWRRTVARRARG